MTALARASIMVYAFFIRLYPSEFQQEYGEELQDTFNSYLADALLSGKGAFLAVCLRELRDLPMNLLRTHLEKKHMHRILHSEPVCFASKGALGFGLSFVAVNLLDLLINDALVRYEFNHVPAFLDQQYQQGLTLGNEVLAMIVASLVGGLLFAGFFADRSRFYRIAALGIAGWLLPGLVYLVLKYSPYANTQWITTASEIVAGLFLGCITSLLVEGHLKRLILVFAGTIFYPLLVETSVKMVWALLPPASPLIVQSFEVYRNSFLFWLVAGLCFGLMMGLILGWSRRARGSL